jgi:hypothetical protein
MGILALCGKAADAAQSWGNTADKEAATKRKASLSTSNAAVSVEQWAVNKAVHYNAWANFGRRISNQLSLQELLGCFSCGPADPGYSLHPLMGLPHCDIVFPAAATVAGPRCLKLVQPLLLQWMKNKASRSVHVKIEDIDIHVRGGDDVEKAIRILEPLLERLRTQSSPAEPSPSARKRPARRKQKP